LHNQTKIVTRWLMSAPFPHALGWLGWVAVVLLATFGGGACARSADAGPVHGTPVPGASAPSIARASDAGSTAPVTSPTGLQTLDTEAIRREMHKALGRVLFVHLWASWCGPCLEELPLIDRFARTARARGGVVLSLALDTDYRGIARIPAVLHARAPSLTVAIAYFKDPDQFMSLFSKSWQGTIPALFVFDRAGKLVRSVLGEVDPADLDALMADLSPPAPAPGSLR
jgi:thiol-disulfide isomerase/thioredoxin